jgi:hypothetical protein
VKDGHRAILVPTGPKRKQKFRRQRQY